MKTKLIVLFVFVLGGLTTTSLAAGRGPGNAGRAGYRGTPAPCDLSGPGQGTPLRDGSGRAINQRGNPNGTGTPRRDGSGRATAPGKGPKDGSGNRADCPLVPKG